MNKLRYNLGEYLAKNKIRILTYRIIRQHRPDDKDIFYVEYETVKHYLFVRSKFVWVTLYEYDFTERRGNGDCFTKLFCSMDEITKFMDWMCSTEESLVATVDKLVRYNHEVNT